MATEVGAHVWAAMTTAVTAVDWRRAVDVLSALLAPTVAILTVYIAWQQWRTNKDKLRIELYDRRAKVLRAAGKLLGGAMQRADVPPEEIEEFTVGTAEAEFLFDRKTASWLEEVRKRAIHLSVGMRSLKQPGPHEEQLKREIQDDFAWLEARLNELRRRFRKYLAVPR